MDRRTFLADLGTAALSPILPGCLSHGRNATSIAAIRSRYERELFESVVPFWMTHSVDRECGGFITCLDRDGSAYDDFKHLWMQWREVYMFAALWNAGYHDQRYLDLARHGFEFLWRHGRNPDGTYHYLLDRRGAVLSDVDGGQEVFTESFAAIGCAELFRATGEDEFRQEALSACSVYRRKTATGSGNYELLAYPMIELNVLQVMQTAFGGGYEGEIAAAARRICRFADPKTGIMHERIPKLGGFDLATQFGRFVNPGHALEGLSFLLRKLREEPDPELRRFVLHEVRVMGDFGWDAEEGGIWYCRDALGMPMSRHDYFLKAWWPQVEAASAMLRAYEVSGDVWYYDFFLKLDAFMWSRLRDDRYGEWFAYAPVSGRRLHAYKGSRFKGFFHLPRFLLDSIAVLGRLSVVPLLLAAPLAEAVQLEGGGRLRPKAAQERASLSWREGAPEIVVGKNRLPLRMRNDAGEERWQKTLVWIEGDGVRAVNAGWQRVKPHAEVDVVPEFPWRESDRALRFLVFPQKGSALYDSGWMTVQGALTGRALELDRLKAFTDRLGRTETPVVFRTYLPTDDLFDRTGLADCAPQPASAAFTAAGGEDLFFQIAVARTVPEPVRVSFVEASDASGGIPRSACKVRRVDMVETWQAYQPDILDEETDVTLSGLANAQPYMCRVSVPRGLKGGVRTLSFAFEVNGVRRTTEVKVRVRGYDLPERAPVKAAVGLTPVMASRALGTDRRQALAEMLALSAEFGLFPLASSVELPTEIESVDYSLLANWRELDDRFGLVHLGSLQTSKRLRWYFGRKDKAANRYRDEDDYYASVGGLLGRAADIVRAAGRGADAFFYYDEIGYDADPKKSVERLRQIKARTGARLACAFPTPGGRETLDYAADIVDVFYLTIDYFAPERPAAEMASLRQAIAEYQARGKEVWWYMNPQWRFPSFNYILNTSLYRRTHFPQLMRHGLDGSLLWGMTWVAPGFGLDCQSRPMRWQAGADGDGVLAYPVKGRLVPSLRLALLRQSLEDARHLAVLRQRVQACPDHLSADRAREILSFDWLPPTVSAHRMPEDYDYWQIHEEIGDLIESFGQDQGLSEEGER